MTDIAADSVRIAPQQNNAFRLKSQLENRLEMEGLFPGLIKENGTQFLRPAGHPASPQSPPHSTATQPEGTLSAEAAKRSKEETEKIKEAAIQFQAMFINMMLKSMRATLHPENDMLFGGRTQEIFEDMLYDEHAKAMSHSAGFPLADQIVKEVTRYMTNGTDGRAALERARSEYDKNSVQDGSLQGRIPGSRISRPLRQ